MNTSVQVVGKDGTAQTVVAGSELFIRGPSPNSSLRKITAADLEPGEWLWVDGEGTRLKDFNSSEGKCSDKTET